MSETYVKIDCIFRRTTEKAVLIDVGGDDFWIPRSCIHGGDDIRLPDLQAGDEIVLQMMEWVADKNGLL